MTKKIGVLAKRGSPEITAAAKQICKTIKDHGFSTIPEASLAHSARLPGGKPLSHITADLIVTLGGDGTVLKAVREVSDPDTPILSVNMGRRGYLTEVDPAGFEDALIRWMRGDFQLEKQWKLSVLQNNRVVGEALNEALMTPTVPAKMLSLELRLAGMEFYRARADGLVIATPTGSTAHAFSVGGPVLESSLDNLVVAFIAPLQPVRSMVVPANKRLSVLVDNPGPDANLSIDGRLQSKVKVGEWLTFRKSSNSTLFVRFGDTFLQRSLKRLSREKETP